MAEFSVIDIAEAPLIIRLLTLLKLDRWEPEKARERVWARIEKRLEEQQT